MSGMPDHCVHFAPSLRPMAEYFTEEQVSEPLRSKNFVWHWVATGVHIHKLEIKCALRYKAAFDDYAALLHGRRVVLVPTYILFAMLRPSCSRLILRLSKRALRLETAFFTITIHSRSLLLLSTFTRVHLSHLQTRAWHCAARPAVQSDQYIYIYVCDCMCVCDSCRPFAAFAYIK